jgi:hypothetical protein
MSGNAQVGLFELGERVRLPRMKICLEREVELGEMVEKESRSKWLYIVIRRNFVRNLIAPTSYKEPMNNSRVLTHLTV